MEKVQYIVDAQNKRKAVLIQIEDYEKILNKIEELEDELDIKQAVEIIESKEPRLQFDVNNYV